MLHFLIRIHNGLAVSVIDVANGERKAQFTPGGGIFLAANHAGMEEVKLRFSHGAF